MLGEGGENSHREEPLFDSGSQGSVAGPRGANDRTARTDYRRRIPNGARSRTAQQTEGATDLRRNRPTAQRLDGATTHGAKAPRTRRENGRERATTVARGSGAVATVAPWHTATSMFSTPPSGP